jgi:glycerol-3-phosphate acyltransferase PlsY
METIVLVTGVALASFLIGSIPTAYLLVHFQHGKDLRREGSGNIGTLNAYEVSRSRRTGVLVLLIDALKGALPVAALHFFLESDGASSLSLSAAGAALLGAVAGHNYSPWIGWKGGRGLATAAGASLLINPAFVGIWGVFWIAGFFKTRKVHFANIAATVLLPFTVLIGEQAVTHVTLLPDPSGSGTVLIAFLMSLLVFLRHIEPLREMLSSSRNSNG